VLLRHATTLFAFATTLIVSCVETDATHESKIGPDLGLGADVELGSDTALDTERFWVATLEDCLPPKVLVCHIPPGNPGNAHNICIAEPAVQAHLDNHGDHLGVCEPGEEEEPPPPPPVCEPDGDACYVDGDCCSQTCLNGVCGAST
jgi:hypothetical protein